MKGKENEIPRKESDVRSNTNVTKPLNDLGLLKKLNEEASEIKKECSNQLIPFLCQIEGVTANERRKILKDGLKVDGIIKEGLVGLHREDNGSTSSRSSDENIETHTNAFDMFNDKQ